MTISTYDTPFFMEHYYNADQTVQRKTKEAIMKHRKRYLSAIVISKVYKLTLEKDGREVAKLRIDLLAKDFKVVDFNKDLAIQAAELQHNRHDQHQV